MKTIFVVDDDIMIGAMLEQKLSCIPRSEVFSFTTGEACLRNMDLKPTIVILDYYLNSLDQDAKNGLEILKLVQKKAPDTKVIMLSSQAQYGKAAETLIKGAVEYVIKDNDAYEKILNIVKKVYTSNR